MVGKVLEGTFVAVVVFLVLNNAQAFSIAAQTVGNVYGQSVRALQGR